MPQAVTGLFARLKAMVAGFTLAQRTIAIIGVAVLAMGVFALTSWLTRPTMTPLFSGLSPSDASAIVEQLRSSSVPYELTEGGATILVPESEVYDQRLAAASSGLPGNSSAGYSLLDEMGVTSSEFQQSVTYKRAIEGELASTISSMSGVTAASVQLAIPEESVFVQEQADPTASVFIETRNGTTLSAKQVEAIVHLTSAAVSGLNPANVAVVDQSGATLSAVGGDAGADNVASEYEARVASGVQQMLDTVVGAGKASVTVVAEIDRAMTERVEEVYTPAEGAPPASEQVRTETQTGSGRGSAGVLGPDNIAVPDGGEGSSFEATEETRNNVVNKTIESRAIPAGSITRQSVSVAVDEEAAAAVGTRKLSDLVAAAAGIDPARGDVVTVEAVAFSTTTAAAAQAALEAAKESEAAERTAALVRTIVIVVAILAALGVGAFLVLRFRRRGDAAAEFDELFGERPPPLSTLAAGAPAPQQLDAAPTAPVTLEFPAPEPAPEVALELEAEPEEPAQLTLQRRRIDIENIARSDPKRTAELLRSLLDERQPV